MLFYIVVPNYLLFLIHIVYQKLYRLYLGQLILLLQQYIDNGTNVGFQCLNKYIIVVFSFFFYFSVYLRKRLTHCFFLKSIQLYFVFYTFPMNIDVLEHHLEFLDFFVSISVLIQQLF